MRDAPGRHKDFIKIGRLRYQHQIARASRLLCVTGKVQREGLVIHLIADKIDDYTAMLSGLSDIADEGNFDGTLAHADEVRKPVREISIPASPERVFPNGRNFR